MAARRCDDCEIAFPVTVELCPACGDPLAIAPHKYPDRDWEERVRTLRLAGASDDDEKVEAWRLHVLLEAGYPFEPAEKIAKSNADLHQAVELVTQRGCPAETAAEILV